MAAATAATAAGSGRISSMEFVVTPWRSSAELLRLRRDLYTRDQLDQEDQHDRRRNAVNKVFAWRARKQDMPLLLESTADIVDVMLQDENGGLTHNALRLLYATAISRFVTGLADTQIELSRSHPSWFPPGKSFQLPAGLLETRHRIVHRYLPSLAELKRAAKESLDWLWEWYWSHLDQAFGAGGSSEEQADVRERCQAIVKTYVKERKVEIKNRKKRESKAADTALSTYKMRFSPSSTSLPTLKTAATLVQILVDENAILPADKKLGTSMSGAFVVWTPFLLTFVASYPSLLQSIVDRVIHTMNAPSRSTVNLELDPTREGMYEWALHILTSTEWQKARCLSKETKHGKELERKLVDKVLGTCFTQPVFWNLKLAQGLLKDANVSNRGQWLAVLEAARSTQNMDAEGTLNGADEMDVEAIETGLPIRDSKMSDSPEVKTKVQGPQKVLGLWKPRPIGMLPDGWEEEE